MRYPDPEMEAMFAEHQAWLGFCHELNQLGIDINMAERLHAAVTLWGETLSILRYDQKDDVRASAFKEAADRAMRVLMP